MPAQSENEGGQRKKALDERAVQAIDDLLRARATSGASDQRPVSEIVNEALRLVLREDQEDLAAFDERAAEPTLTYEELLNDLKVVKIGHRRDVYKNR